MTKIITLDISNNDFSKLPGELGLMVSLSKLIIEGNPLKTIKSDVKTGGTDKLKKFLATRIDPSKITPNGQSAKVDLIEKELGVTVGSKDMTQLLFNYMSNNSILAIGLSLADVPREVLSFEKVHTIDFSKNGIVRFPVILAGMRSLRTLRLNDNQITNISFIELAPFPSLESLEVRNNKLNDFCPDYLIGSRSVNGHGIKSIDLSKNNLKYIPAIFAEFPKLSTLNISFNLLQDIEYLIENENRSLDTLILANNKIVNISGRIANLVKLSALVLENNEIKNFPPQIGLLKLKALNIIGNPSILSMSKMTTKGTQFLLNNLFDKLHPDEVKEYEYRTSELNSKGGLSISSKPKIISKEKIEEENSNYKPSSINKLEEEPHIYSKKSISKLENESGNISNMQPTSSHKFMSQNSLETKNQNTKFLEENLPGVSNESKPIIPTQVSAENLERQIQLARIKELQDTLDNEYSLSNVKKLQIRKELNSLRANLK